MKSTHHPVIVMTGGGSGGHITPILSLAQELKRLEPEGTVVYIGHKGDNFDSLRASGHNFDFMAFISAGKFRRYHGQSLLSHLVDFKSMALNVRDFFRVIGAVGASLRILNKVKPDVVFVKGGFVGVPVGIAARLKRVPIVTHDSDTVGGLANRIVGRWATVRATGLPTKYYDYGSGKIIYTGIPLDPRLKPITLAEQGRAKRDLGLAETSFMLLVAGGGLGAKSINDRMLTVAGRLLEANLALHIVHIAGAVHREAVSAGYHHNLSPPLSKRVEVLGFTNDFYKYVAAADLIVSRAGATSIAEYALAAKSVIIIPNPFLTAGHQLKNAELLRAGDAAVIVDQQAPAEELEQTIKELMSSDPRRRQLAQELHKLAKPTATHDLAEVILDVAKAG